MDAIKPEITGSVRAAKEEQEIGSLLPFRCEQYHLYSTRTRPQLCLSSSLLVSTRRDKPCR